MFDRLIASGNHFVDRPLAPSGTVALLVHAGVCAAAVLATLRPQLVRLPIGFTLAPTR